MVKKRQQGTDKPVRQVPEAGRNSFRQLAYMFLSLIISLFLLVGYFDLGGILPQTISEYATYGCGLLSWTLLPTLVIYLAITKYLVVGQKLSASRWVPVVIIFVGLAGMLHVFIDQPQALDVVTESRYGGGYLGYGLAYALVYSGILHPWLAFVILLVTVLVAVLALFNLSFLKICRFLWGFISRLWVREEDPKEPVKKIQPDTKPKKVFAPSLKMPKKSSSTPADTLDLKDEVVKAPADPNWRFPPLNLLVQKQEKADTGDLQATAEIIEETLANFNIDVQHQGANAGPRVTQYMFKPPSGIKLSRIVGLESNIALDLAAASIRIEAPIPGKRAVGIEVPNKKPATVRLGGLLSSPSWRAVKPGRLAFCIGQDITGKTEIAYLERMPHLLLAGQTGSGKSVGINVLLTSLLYRNSPSDLKLILVDPKQVELGPYNDIPHLLTPVITSPEKCVSALKWTVAEMERRLKEFAKFSRRNIAEYNALKDQISMPYIVLVIDELADLMIVASKEVESLIVRIAQKARAAGIHLVLATQRPSVNVITGLIKANIPARLAFTTASQVDSRTILDQIGAEKLLGQGDILYLNSVLPKPKRLQGALITDEETAKICDFLKNQAEVQYDSEVIGQDVNLSTGRGGQGLGQDDARDELFAEAVEAVVEAKKASTSLLQRRLRIGYARAARLIESLEEQGIIGPADGSRPRAVLLTHPSMTDELGEDEDETENLLEDDEA